MQKIKNLGTVLAKKQEPIKIIYISSYFPRKCGVATFTKDLTAAINNLNPNALAEIIAMTDNGQEYDYPWEVKFRINQYSQSDYALAAHYINQSSADILCLQHEFGLYDGHDSAFSTCLSAGLSKPSKVDFEKSIQSTYSLLSMLDDVTKPVITTFHVILSDPSIQQAYEMRRVIERSEAVVAMTESSRQTLIDIYDCPPEKAVVIPHGVPEFTFNQIEKYQRKLKIKNAKPMILSAGFLGPGKGVEYMIAALPKIVKSIPHAKLYIVGQTHPIILRHEGEEYRNSLIALIKKLKVSKHVKFINRFLDDIERRNYYQAADFYVTIFPNLQQSASGNLAWALGAGKICVSTAYQHAKEMLSDGTGILVKHQDSDLIADSIIDTFNDPEKVKVLRKLAYEKGRMMTWSNIGLNYLNLFRLIAKEKQSIILSDKLNNI